MKKFWIEHQDTDTAGLNTIGIEPLPGATANDAWNEYVRRVVSIGNELPDLDEYLITEAQS